MGTYALDITHLWGRNFQIYHEKSIREKNNLIQAVQNTVNSNTVIHEELISVFQNNNNPTSGKSCVLNYREDTDNIDAFFTTGGASGYIVSVLDKTTGLFDNKGYKSYITAQDSRSRVYIPSIKRYIISSHFGIDFIDPETWLPTGIVDRADWGGINEIAYDFDNLKMYIITTNSVNYFVSEVDLKQVPIVSGGIDYYYSSKQIHQLSINKTNVKFFSYNSTLNKVTFVDETNGNVYSLDPALTLQSSTLVSNGIATIVAYQEEVDSNNAYVCYYDSGITTIYRIDLTSGDPSLTVLSQKVLQKTYGSNNIDKLSLIYADKAVVLLLSNSSDTETDDLNGDIYVKVLSKDLNYDLSNEKRIYNPSEKIGPTTMLHNSLYAFPDTFGVGSLDYKYKVTNKNNYVKPLSSQTDRIYIPTFGSNNIKNYFQYFDISNRIPYPTIVNPVIEDCCLPELIVDINCKLVKNSCEATKRSIVGRHFNNVWKNSQLLEAVLWVTTFDCLSCDEIEKLKCIISKI